MDDALVHKFITDGFVKIPDAFSASTAEQCADLLWKQTGCDRDDPSTWTQPVHWVGGLADKPFAEAVNTPVLHDAYDALVGPGRWAPRNSLGTFPLRFPHDEEPGDAGWHIEGSYVVEGESWPFSNVRSRDRALLMLFLFTDVDESNAPTRIRVGSHLDIPPILERFGEAGVSGLEIAEELSAASKHRETVFATGKPGDVFLCHPFLVHAAQPNHGTRPRFMAQPPLLPKVAYELERADGDYSPVEVAIRQALNRR